MLGTRWRPSEIEDEIYDIMGGYEMGPDLYQEEATEAIAEYLMNCLADEEWKLGCALWPNEAGGVCSVSWVEKGHLHMIMFDYWVERRY